MSDYNEAIQKLRDERYGLYHAIHDARIRVEQLEDKQRRLGWVEEFPLIDRHEWGSQDRAEMEEAAANLERLFKREYELSICAELRDRIGIDGHDFYQTIYPINRDTRVEIVRYQPGMTSYHYPLPMKPSPIPKWGEDISPIGTAYKYGEAQFRDYGDQKTWHRMAFAPEINVVFIAARI